MHVAYPQCLPSLDKHGPLSNRRPFENSSGRGDDQASGIRHANPGKHVIVALQVFELRAYREAIGAVGKLLNTQQQAHFFDPRIHAAVELIHHLVSGIGTAIANIRLELNGRFPGSDPTQQ